MQYFRLLMQEARQRGPHPGRAALARIGAGHSNSVKPPEQTGASPGLAGSGRGVGRVRPGLKAG